MNAPAERGVRRRSNPKLIPLDFLKHRPQPASPPLVDRCNERHATRQMFAERRMALPVLARRTTPHTIVQRGLEAVEVVARHVEPLVRHNPRQTLPNTLPHNPRLAMISRKAFFGQNRGGMDRKHSRMTTEIFAAGKRQVVGVPCVSGIRGTREAREPAVRPPEAGVGERRR